ncbi:MAG: hypothetical protein JWN41_863 [Thermoleophilia bacterium]|nr:hypothetical protein [Thermoleophilia bacterium]
MSFYYSVNTAISRANSALSQLYSYNNYASPASEPNRTIRNQARLTIDPSYYDLKNAVSSGRWEGVSSRDARNANYAADLLGQATFSLSDRPDEGRPANVPQAVRQIRQAVNLLNRARW